MAVMRHLRARHAAALEASWDWLDDADFSTAAIRFNADAHTVTLPFTNYTDDPGFPPRKPSGAGPLSVSFLQPWFRCLMTVHQARAMKPAPEALEEPGILKEVQWAADRRVIRIDSINDLASFEVEVGDFDVELVVTDEIDHWRKHHRGRVLGWEYSGRRVGD